MRRVNVQAAFMGEGGESEQGDDEGLVLSVRGGEVVLVVPAGTPDGRAVNSASVLRGALRLENGRVLTFEIQDGAVGALFEDEPATLFDEREATGADGLSSLTSRAHEASFGGAAALMGATAYARDVMSRDVIHAEPTHSVDEAARLLTFHHVSGLPVCNEGRVVGVISEADLIGKSGSTVADVMTSPALTVPDTASLDEVAALLTQQHIRRVPVVDPLGRLVGVVSRSDVLRWAAGIPREAAEEQALEI